MHDETYRMLGREREAELLREAARITRAAEAQGRSPSRRRFAAARALLPELARFFSPRLSSRKPASEKGATT